MEPALDVINRALQGEPGARSFLERTSSIYVLDVNDASNPKTYGCWNFIHQAMNEVERHESRYLQQETNGGDLVGHARMLASMALRVARRSPLTDRALVATCVSNASQYTGPESQSQWLVDLNLELREIVIGRIAAMAFDFSFHRRAGSNGQSAFADRVVMDTFCAILSANAVASGPPALRHFATEWIIPSSRNLPSFAVASVVLHLASEGIRKSAPAGTKDMLQQLSLPAMNIVLVPTLFEAVSGNESEYNSLVFSREESSRVAAMSLRAMKMWCDATDLSLPQIKHICSKVDVNVVEVLSDAMYSDSHQVIDALAELIEASVQIPDEKVMSHGRMSQVRHIIQVDETSFQAQFTPQQLKTIESHEMASIVDELMSAIGLQRFRFAERQSKGDYDVCRNLSRIAASVCDTWLDILAHVPPRQPETGAINLLLKGAGHPSVNLCAICLQVLTRMMPIVPSLAQELLPILQRRAITPHHLQDGIIRLDALDLCGVTFQEFQNFRETVLSEALVVCWRGYGGHFMDSCTSAVEEFCSFSSSGNVSLQLEAALFCIEQIAKEALDARRQFAHNEQMARLLSALPTKPPSLMANHVTRERMCRFIRKYSRWFAAHNGLGVATDLVMASFRIAISSDPSVGLLRDNARDLHPSSVQEASLTLQELLCCAPKHFATESSFLSLTGLWGAAYTAIDHSDVVRIDDRVALCCGIGVVLAALPDDQSLSSFEAMASLPLGRLERLTSVANNAHSYSQLSPTLPHIGDEIRIISALSRSFADASGEYGNGMENGYETSPDRRALMTESVLQIIRRGWPSVKQAAENWADDERVATGIASFLSDLLPPTCNDENSLKLLQDLCSISSSILRNTRRCRAHFEVSFGFICKFLVAYGGTVEKEALASLNGCSNQGSERDVAKLLEELMITTVAAVQECLGSVWTSHSEQGNGQDAFESKGSPARKPLTKSNESLVGILSLLKQAVISCPNFLLHLPSQGKERDDDLLIRRAIDSAVASLNDSDPEITRNAIAFLKTLAQHSFSQHTQLKFYVSESLTRLRADCIGRLVLGSCGKYEYKTLADVAELLSLLLRTTSTSENEAYLVASLRQDHFLLGERARNVVLGILTRSGAVQHNPLTSSDLALFLKDIWQLHQIDDTDALPGSDEVARFLLKYS